jgi:hypothetical protein
MPKIAMLEGYRGLPSYDGTAFCREFDDAMDRVKIAYQKAQSVGISESDTRMMTAKQFISRESGVFSTWVAWGDACKGMVSEANKILAELNGLIITGGGLAVRPSESGQVPPDLLPSPNETLSHLKWIVIGVGGLAALFYLGPVIKSFAKPKRKAFSGYKRRRR